MRIKKGDIVGRISYGKDIIFIVERIIKSKKHVAVLKGLTIRIEADAPLEDLEKINKDIIKNNEKRIDYIINKRINEICTQKDKRKTHVYTGKILHLDGDRKYSEKSLRYYNKMGLNAIVKNIPENKQALVVYDLLEKYKPDILVVTGHDAMFKNNSNYNDIYNYRNSKHFINTVKEARRWGINSEKLVIFAGACQSFFEAIMYAGADFASSPGRILIDFIDPLIVAEKIATTDNYRYVTIREIIEELKDGDKGIGGVSTKGKKRNVTTL